MLPVRLNDPRRTSATLPMAREVDGEIISERLRHSTIGMTLHLYSRATARLQSGAAIVTASQQVA